MRAHLRPGLSDGDIDRLTLASVGSVLPADDRAWWGWHDGAASGTGADPRDREIAPGWSYLGLQEAIELYRGRCAEAYAASVGSREVPGMDDPRFWWRPTWFPITQDDRRVVLACDCAVPAGSASPIVRIDWEEAAEPGWDAPRLRSFAELIELWARSLD